MFDANSAGIGIFVVYFLIIFGLGVAASRYQNSSEDFWVAGRRFGLPIMVMANMAAILNGGALISGAGYAARFGGVAILPFFGFALGIAIIFFWIAKKLREFGGFTLPDYMGDRFDSTALRAWSAAVVAISSIVYLVAQIRGMAFVLESLLQVDFFWGLALGTLIFVGYVALGGLLAVVWTNVAQFIFVWAGLMILAPSLYEHFGGWYDMIAKVEAVAPGWTSLKGLEWSWSYLVSWHLIWCVAYCTRVELVTKMYAACDSRIARYSLPFTVLLVIVFLTYGNLYLGAAARVLVWDGIRSPDQAFPLLVTSYLTPVVGAFVLTGIASAAMSTTDSLLLMSGSAVAHDIVRKCIHEPRGIVRDEVYYLRISRLSIVAVGAIAFLCAIPDVALLLRIVSFAVAILGACFFFPLVVGLNCRRVSREAAIASSVGGVTVTVLWIACTLYGLPWAATLHPGVPGLAAAGTLMLTVSLATRPVRREVLARFFAEQSA
ncbi:MAG: sodium:solute symporter family protein [Gammaproteobacteria bacterium]|jgi:Na+/proline symporter|nr:sodium:solute symporter family protein [Gammaproteobacteria bacterium]